MFQSLNFAYFVAKQKGIASGYRIFLSLREYDHTIKMYKLSHSRSMKIAKHDPIYKLIAAVIATQIDYYAWRKEVFMLSQEAEILLG